MVATSIYYMTWLRKSFLVRNSFMPLSNKFFSTKLKSTSEEMVEILKSKFPLAKTVEVVDVSGGCGDMYEVLVESEEFKGLSIVKQHRLINETLKEQIKVMHGLRIHTLVPKNDEKT